MNKKFYGILKLVTGEEILAQIKKMDGEYEGFFILHIPIQVEEISIPGLISGLKIDRWMKVSNQETFLINIDKIVTMSELDSSMELFYKKSIEKLIIEESNYNSPIKKDQTIENFRSKLEQLFKDY